MSWRVWSVRSPRVRSAMVRSALACSSTSRLAATHGSTSASHPPCVVHAQSRTRWSHRTYCVAPEPRRLCAVRAGTLRPPSLEVPGGGAGLCQCASVHARICSAHVIKSPGSIATPASKSKVEACRYRAPALMGYLLHGILAYDTISVRLSRGPLIIGRPIWCGTRLAILWLLLLTCYLCGCV